MKLASGYAPNLGAELWHPEKGLSETARIAPGTNMSDSLGAFRSGSIVLSMSFQGLNGDGGGLIMEHGGSYYGMAVYYSANGYFVVRGFGSSTDIGENSSAYLVVTGGVPKGDGTLVVELRRGGYLRVWWNGVEIRGVQNFNSAPGDIWTGTDNGRYLTIDGSTSEPVGTFVSNVVQYEWASDLRVYGGQEVGKPLPPVEEFLL